MHLAEIHIFPVKAMAGVSVAQAACDPCGLRQDRRWLVTEPSGRFLTQRVLQRLAVVQARPVPSGLVLEAAGHAPLAVAEPDAGTPAVSVTVWRDSVQAVPAAEAAHDWLSEVLGTPVRLVHMAATDARAVAARAGQPGGWVSFADGYPVLLCTDGSLADLNARLAVPVPVSRFRPNLVIHGAPAWAEDCWRLIRIGGAVLRVAKPCDRCLVTTIDQETGERPQRMEPLRTLGQFRQEERGIMFGQNLLPVTLGDVHVGDAIEVLESGPPNVAPL